MSKQKQQNILILGIIIIGCIYAGFNAVLVYMNLENNEQAEFLWLLVYASSIALWAQRDAHEHKLYQPYEFGYFVFLFWPFFLPYQMVKTRGLKGLAFYLGFICLYFLPQLSGRMVRLLFFS